MLSIEGYRDFIVLYGRRPDSRLKSGKLSDLALNKYYVKYCKSFSKKYGKDLKWEEVRKEVFERDRVCQLSKILSEKEMKDASLFFITKEPILDCAHVFSRGAFPWLKYDVDNVVLLRREFHSLLDSGKNPLNGKPIEKKDTINFWIRIIGLERFIKLMSSYPT